MLKAMNNDDYKLVYSSEGLPETNAAKKVEEIVPGGIVVKIGLEKKGRGGKCVSILYELPYNPAYFKKLLKELKSHCGTGGAQKGDILEIQGDHREKIKLFLEKKGFKAKLAGG